MPVARHTRGQRTGVNSISEASRKAARDSPLAGPSLLSRTIAASTKLTTDIRQCGAVAIASSYRSASLSRNRMAATADVSTITLAGPARRRAVRRDLSAVRYRGTALHSAHLPETVAAAALPPFALQTFFERNVIAPVMVSLVSWANSPASRQVSSDVQAHRSTVRVEFPPWILCNASRYDRRAAPTRNSVPLETRHRLPTGTTAELHGVRFAG